MLQLLRLKKHSAIQQKGHNAKAAVAIAHHLQRCRVWVPEGVPGHAAPNTTTTTTTTKTQPYITITQQTSCSCDIPSSPSVALQGPGA
jgi:hypothetical protein